MRELVRKAKVLAVGAAYLAAIATPFIVPNDRGVVDKAFLTIILAVVLGLAGVLYMFKFEVGDYPYSDTM